MINRLIFYLYMIPAAALALTSIPFRMGGHNIWADTTAILACLVFVTGCAMCVERDKDINEE